MSEYTQWLEGQKARMSKFVLLKVESPSERSQSSLYLLVALSYIYLSHVFRGILMSKKISGADSEHVPLRVSSSL